MSYRDEIVEHAEACLAGLEVTFRSPRVDELSPENVETIYQYLQDLVHLAEKVLSERGVMHD